MPANGQAVPDDPATKRRRQVVVAGFKGQVATAREALGDPVPAVRSAALGALARLGELSPADLVAALADPAPAVRRRAAELAGSVPPTRGGRSLRSALASALDDPDPLVVDAACAALGERRDTTAVARLAEVATGHGDARCRESAVAALGALGHPDGLPAVLAAMADRPPVRRRAVVALAAFSGPEVEAALRRALDDRDWQVRQAAEVLLDG